MRVPLASLVLVGVIFLGCTVEIDTGLCSSDVDCLVNQRCVQSHCVSKECSPSCPAGQYCASGACVTCADDSHCGSQCLDCASGQSDRVCVQQACGCKSGGDCKAGETCSASRCHGPLCGNGKVDTGETCGEPGLPACPTSCDDGDPCTADALTGSASSCDAACSHTPITKCEGGDGCCPAGCTNANDSDCQPLCGNGKVDKGETCGEPGLPACPKSCDDGDACTVDKLTGSASKCNAACSHTPITECLGGDGCCPAGCTSANDSDCSPLCGNGKVDPGETCGEPGLPACPTSCVDADACTTDVLTGSAGSCNAVCSHSPITACQGGDGCCPAGCACLDSDCPSHCNNGVMDCDETGIDCGGSTCAACNVYPGDLSGKYSETVVLELTDPSQLFGSFQGDHRNIQPGPLPACASFNAGSVTFSGQECGVAVANPLLGESFYKIEVVLADASQQTLSAFLTAIDVPWKAGVTTNGLSAGIDTGTTKSAYWYDHTQLSTAGLTAAQVAFSKAAQSRLVPRVQGDVLIELYVTPIGTYPVINGANYMSFPNLYTGSMVYDQQQNPLAYVVLGKWHAGGDPVTFKGLRFVRLDSQIDDVHEVNAYFIKKTVSTTYFQNAVANPNTPMSDNLWLAFLYRGYDYYFKTDHRADVRTLVDRFIAGLPAYIDASLPSYGQGFTSTLTVNHSFINSIQAWPMVNYALSGYLRPDQLESIRQQFARVLDTSMSYIRTDGECRFETQNSILNSATNRYDEEVTYQGVQYQYPWDTAHDHPGGVPTATDLTQVSRYVVPLGPCYGLGAGQCRFSTRTFNQGVESITANGKAYNYFTDGTPWPQNGGALSAVARFQSGPCAGHPDDCDFETRTFVTMTDGTLVESITAYGKAYNFSHNTATNTWDPWPSNGADLTTIAQYTATSPGPAGTLPGPCTGRQPGDCHFDTRDWTPAGDTITAYGNIYRFSTTDVQVPGYDNLAICSWYPDGWQCHYREGPCRFIFPQSEGYIADTFAEEISWLLSFYTGYLVTYPTDSRADKLREYITFLGFHHMSKGESIRQQFPGVAFSQLGPEYLDFSSRYLWDDGSIDNHGFHPSLNYGEGVVATAAIVHNVLEKNGIVIPTVTHNMDLAYNANVAAHLDISRFKHKPGLYVPEYDRVAFDFKVAEDAYIYSPDGSLIANFAGATMPSLLEDWASPFNHYHVVENYGDYATALPFARNVYYGFYFASGNLFCNGACAANTSSFYSFDFGDALYALLFSMKSSFDPTRP
jgi:hypothetical protein